MTPTENKLREALVNVKDITAELDLTLPTEVRLLLQNVFNISNEALSIPESPSPGEGEAVGLSPEAKELAEKWDSQYCQWVRADDENITNFFYQIASELLAGKVRKEVGPTQCRNCGKDHGLQDIDAGTDREVQRLCKSCYEAAPPPAGEKMRDMLRFTEEDVCKEGDLRLTVLKQDKNHITKLMNKDEETSYNTGFHKGFTEGYELFASVVRQALSQPPGNDRENQMAMWHAVVVEVMEKPDCCNTLVEQYTLTPIKH